MNKINIYLRSTWKIWNILLGRIIATGCWQFKLQGRIECSRLERNRAGEGTTGSERGMCLIPCKYIWPALSRSKDPRVFNAQERSWKERLSLAQFSLQHCSGISLWRMETPKWLKLSG